MIKKSTAGVLTVPEGTSSYFALKNPGSGWVWAGGTGRRGAVGFGVFGGSVGRAKAMLSAPGWPMFRTRAEQVSGWEAALPAELLRLPEELARVDALLDDSAFFAPFAPFASFFDPQMGRSSTPMETYLRLMFLKFRYRLGYETLCREVADSISWRRFCRIRLDGQVPHPTTLMKLITRCGPAAVDACNEPLLAGDGHQGAAVVLDQASFAPAAVQRAGVLPAVPLVLSGGRGVGAELVDQREVLLADRP